jgi:signal transduction histidine kinase
LRINPYRTDDHTVSGVVVSMIDIDAAKGTQKGLTELVEFSRAIVEASRYPLAVLTDELRVESANRAFCRLLELSRDEVVGHLVYELNKGQWDILELRNLLNNIARTGALFDDFEVSRNIPGIGQRSLLLNARVLEGKNLASRMIVLAISDVTEQKRLNHDLRETSSELLRSNAELDHFATVASHDLQEPMRMIKSYGDLLKKKAGKRLDEASQQYLTFMIDGAKRMQNLIKSILDYSRAGHQALKRDAIDLTVAIGTARLNLDRALARADASIECGPLPTLSGDALQLTQLFQNLISNALKFRSPDRPCVIAISSQESDQGWTVSVTDNGIGIPAEDFDRIFNLFQRLHAPSEYTGTGIGLATCKKIMERNGGRIWLDSTLQIGTTFHVFFPKATRPAADRV